MAVRCDCPKCGTALQVQNDFVGKPFACPNCRTRIIIPVVPVGQVVGADGTNAPPSSLPFLGIACGVCLMLTLVGAYLYLCGPFAQDVSNLPEQEARSVNLFVSSVEYKYSFGMNGNHLEERLVRYSAMVVISPLLGAVLSLIAFVGVLRNWQRGPGKPTGTNTGSQ